MNLPKLEAFLARIYTDQKARMKFLSNPLLEAERAGLSPEECQALENLDRVGLELMAASLVRKRQRVSGHKK